MPDISRPIRVLIVDDSPISHTLLLRALRDTPDIVVAGTAADGEAALKEASRLLPDIILLDTEMPLMDGLAILPHLLKLSPQPRIIMVSSMTPRNAEISVRALALGASDHVAHPLTSPGGDKLFYRDLVDKIRTLAPPRTGVPFLKAPPPSPADRKSAARSLPVRAVAIGCSIGGPQALSTLFKGLATQTLRVPVFVTQHMPAAFTPLLAEHISQQGVACHEGRDGEIVESGRVYLAPGDFHLTPERWQDKVIVRLSRLPPVHFSRPAVDPMLQALASIYGAHLLTAILTGMGRDGLDGARAAVEAGGTVIAQDEATSIVWGMPRAVAEQHLCSALLPLPAIAPYILNACEAS